MDCLVGGQVSGLGQVPFPRIHFYFCNYQKLFSSGEGNYTIYDSSDGTAHNNGKIPVTPMTFPFRRVQFCVCKLHSKSVRTRWRRHKTRKKMKNQYADICITQMRLPVKMNSYMDGNCQGRSTPLRKHGTT